MRPVRHGRLAVVLAFTVMAAPIAVRAEDPPPAGSPAPATTSAPPACVAPEYRQFDFWVGEWDVQTPDGKLAGTNRIERILGGCVLQESWKGARGMTGHSFNTYDPGDRMWHQTWVDDRGTLLLLAGEFRDGAMVLNGATAARGTSKAALHRITWTPNADGTVRQLWESSEDGGKSWAVAFDGSYRRKK